MSIQIMKTQIEELSQDHFSTKQKYVSKRKTQTISSIPIIVLYLKSSSTDWYSFSASALAAAWLASWIASSTCCRTPCSRTSWSYTATPRPWSSSAPELADAAWIRCRLICNNAPDLLPPVPHHRWQHMEAWHGKEWLLVSVQSYLWCPFLLSFDVIVT